MNRNLVHCLACCTAFFGIMLLGPALVAADEIILLNGDRFTGKVEHMGNGVLSFRTDYSQPIEINLSAVRKITTYSPVEVRLSSGETLKGTISSDQAGKITIAASDPRSATTVDTLKIAAINPPPVKWDGGITLAGSMQSGNTDRTGASVAIEGGRRGERDRISLSYLFNYGEEEDEVTTRNHFGALKYDYFFLSKMYGYLGLDVFNDRFRDLQLRTTIGPGVGYQVWEDPEKALGLEAGLSYLSENYYEASDTDSLAARLAANFLFHFGTFLVFTDQVAFYPSLEGGEPDLLRNEATISAPLGAGWALRLSHILDYSSDPPDDVKKTDTTTLLGLQYVF